MRMMLEEEIARAQLVGDGRLSSSDDKIKEDKSDRLQPMIQYIQLRFKFRPMLQPLK